MEVSLRLEVGLMLRIGSYSFGMEVSLRLEVNASHWKLACGWKMKVACGWNDEGFAGFPAFVHSRIPHLRWIQNSLNRTIVDSLNR